MSQPNRRTRFLFLMCFLAGSLATPSVAEEPGTHARTLESGQEQRQYLLHIPQSYKQNSKKPLPLVVMLHGRTSNGEAAASAYYGWRSLADKEGFIAAFPTALGSPTSWEGAWRGKPTADSTFLAELIDALLEELRIDPNRVYMTGHSSGGFMSYSFATTHSDKVAAIGPVAGLMVGTTEPTAPVSVIAFHGTADKVVAYDGSGRSSAVGSAEFFRKQDGCSDAVRKDIAKGLVHVDTWSGGKNGSEVVLYTIEGGDHGWPQGGSRSVAATERIWEFFKTHPRPVDPAKLP